jgi:hypothetical protein
MLHTYLHTVCAKFICTVPIYQRNKLLVQYYKYCMYIDSSFYSTQLFEEIQNSTAGLLLTTYLSVTEVGLLHICLLSRQAYSVAYLSVAKAGLLHIYL